MKKHLLVLTTLATTDKPNTEQIAGKTGIATSTVKRIISELRTDCNVKIDHIRTPGAHGRVGYFVISDWGIFNKERFSL